MLQSETVSVNLIENFKKNSPCNHQLKTGDDDISGRVNVEDALERILITRDGFQDQPFAIFDLEVIRQQYELWHIELPDIVPYYAVKCNPDPGIIKRFVELGCGFDCASQSEMALALELGASPDELILAHPCKLVSHLQFAHRYGVRKMTVDNLDELDSIKKHCPDAELVIRIATDDRSSIIPLSGKFGVPFAHAEELLAKAKQLNLSVIGVSFHVGGNCSNPDAYRLAISDARSIFDIAKNYEFNCSFLDIGGGFSNSKTHPKSIKFTTLTEVIRSALSEFFYDIPDLKLIGEPGQYMVASCVTLVAQIIARRLFRSSIPSIDNMYYINDGTHGTLNGIIYNTVPPYTVCRMFKGQLKAIKFDDHSETFPSCVWGPTCNSMDLVISKESLPILNVGDYFIFQNVGAYRAATSSQFNGFGKPDAFYIN